MGILADEFVRVRPDVSGIEGPVRGTLGKAGTEGGRSFGGKFKEQVKTLVAGLGVTFAAVEIIKGIKDTFKESVAASREQASLNRITQNVIRTTGDVSNVTLKHVQDLASGLGKQAGVTREVVQGGENLLLTFGKIRNQLGPGNDIFDRATSDALDLSKALGVSMPAASTKIGKALNDPIHGLTALSKAGITFTDQQKKQIKTMVDSGNILGAQKVILAELEKRYKGTAAAAATPADRMHAAWHELLVDIGNRITPVLDKLSLLFANKILPAIEDVLNGTSSWNKAIKTTADKVKDVVNNCAPLKILIEGIVAAIGLYVATNVGIFIVNNAIKLSADAWRALNATIKANWIILTIGLIVAALIYAYTHFQAFRDVVAQVWKAVQVAVSVAWTSVLKPVLAQISAGFQKLLPVLTQLWTKGFQPLVQTVGGAFIQLYNTAIKPYGNQIMFVIRTIAAVVIWWVQHITIPFIRLMVLEFQIAIKVIIFVIQALIATIRVVVAVTTWWITNVTIPMIKLMVAAVSFAINSVIIPTIHGLIVAYNWVVAAAINLKNWTVAAWNGIWATVVGAWHVIQGVWNAMNVAISRVGQWAQWLWATMQATWNAIITYISAAWHGTIAVIFSALNVGLNTIGNWATWLWATWHGAWNAILGFISAAYHGTIAGIFTAMNVGLNTIGNWSSWLWATIQATWSRIVGWVSAAWHGTLEVVFGLINSGMNRVGQWVDWLGGKFKSGFDTIVKWAGFFRTTLLGVWNGAISDLTTAWNKIKGAFGTPINWVISNVYTGGVKKLWDGVAGLVGLPKLPPLSPLKFAGGGVVPGRPDRLGRDDVMARMTKGEGVLTVGEMDKLGGARGFNMLRAALAGFRKGGIIGGLPGYDGGGIVGTVGSAIGHFFSGVKDKAFEILSNIASGGLKTLAKPILALTNKLPGSGDWVKALKQIPKNLLNKAIGFLTGKASSAVASQGFGGSSVSSVLAFLQSIAGRIPYVLGGVGPGSYDCSGLVGEVWARLTGHKSYQRYFVTGTEKSFLTSHGFTKGADPKGFTVGFNGEHTTGSLLGHNFEAAHTGTTMRFNKGTPATGFPNVYHLAQAVLGKSVNGTLGKWIQLALGFVHRPMTWAGPLETLVMRESGGNPNAVNRSDSNARRGNPSGGLAQTTISTFAAYRDKSLVNDMFNPVSNLVAALRYIIARYGTIFNVQQADEHKPPKGYRHGGIIQQIASMDSGGYLERGWNLIHNGLNYREPVGAAIGGGVHHWNVSLAVTNLEEIRSIEDFLNRMGQSARAKG